MEKAERLIENFNHVVSNEKSLANSEDEEFIFGNVNQLFHFFTNNFTLKKCRCAKKKKFVLVLRNHFMI